MSFGGSVKSADIVLSNGNNTAGKSGGSGSWRGVLGNGALSGKVYFEIAVTAFNDLYWLGIGTNAAAMNASPATGGAGTACVYSSDGYKGDGSSATSIGTTYGAGDVIGIAFDADAGKIWFAKNNAWVASGNPAAGTSPVLSGISGSYMPIASMSGSAGSTSVTIADAANQTYSPPSGFTAANIIPFAYVLAEKMATRGNQMTAALMASAAISNLRI